MTNFSCESQLTRVIQFQFQVLCKDSKYKMMSLVLFVMGGLLLATAEGCGAGKQMLSKFYLNIYYLSSFNICKLIN